MDATHEQNKRTVAKSITWRILAIVITFVVSLVFFEDVILSLGFTFVVQFIKTIVYYIHERIWSKESWGYANLQQIKMVYGGEREDENVG